MNSRNVETLCRLYADAFLVLSWDDIQADLQTHMALRDAVRRGCEKLAAAGVLVTSALTDEQAEDVSTDPEDSETMDRNISRDADGVRAALERIAKGEAER